MDLNNSNTVSDPLLNKGDESKSKVMEEAAALIESDDIQEVVDTQQTGVESYRWLVLACYVGLNASIALTQNGFSPVLLNTAAAFGVEEELVAYNGLTYLILFTPTELLYTFAYKHLPMSWVLKQSAVFQLFGIWLRMFAAQKSGSFGWVLAGNFFVAWTNAPIQMATTKVAERWFAPNERTLAVSAQAFAFIFGGIAGFILGPIFVPAGATKDDVFTLMFYQSITVTIFSLPTLFFFNERPTIPASVASAVVSTKSTWEELKVLMKNLNFHLLLWNFTFSIVIYDLIALLVDPLTSGYYDGFEISLFAISFVILGVVGLFVVTYIIDKHNKFLVVQRIWSWAACFVMFISIFTMTTGSFPIFLCVIASAGFFVIPTTASGMAFAAEVTFPVETSLVNGTISMVAHGIAAIVGHSMIHYVSNHQVGTLWIFFMFATLGGMTTIFMTEDLRRQAYEAKKKEIIQSTIQIDGENTANQMD